MIDKIVDILAEEIANAARKTFSDLFKNGERYYYCALVTTWEGHAPFVSAWSWEALHRELEGYDNPQEQASFIKWSYADSPYCDVGSENFATVRKLFAERPPLHELDDETGENELLNIRFLAMEQALRQIDAEGIFNANQPRETVCILVDPMPPDKLNTQIALRLNDPQSPIMQDWLAEAAE